MAARRLKSEATETEFKALKSRLNSPVKLSKLVLLPFFDTAEYLTANCKPEFKEELARILGTPARVQPLDSTPLFQTRNINSVIPVEVVDPSHRRSALIGLGRALVEADGSAIMNTLQASSSHFIEFLGWFPT